MSGVTNRPERLTHPTPPATGRVLHYIFDDGAGTVEPFYMLDDGIPRSLVGVDGTNGIDGTNGTDGIDGIDGLQGPPGPMNVEAFITEPGTVTLPNTTTKTLIYTNPVTISATGNCFVDISIAHRPHSAGNDARYDVRFDGVILDPQYNEEHKDSNTAQEMWRAQCLDLGNVSAGAHTIELFFSKESTGGTAQIKNYTAKIVRYS